MITIKESWDRSPWMMAKEFVKNNIRKKVRYTVSEKLKEKTGGGYIRQINIETVNRCNNNCSFCATSVINEKREKKYMDDKVFDQIVEQIKELNLNKVSIRPNINNELLLDKKICERIKKLATINNVYITCETNGILINIEKIYEMYRAGMRQITIDDYADNILDYLFHTKRVREIRKKCDRYMIESDVNLVLVHRLKKQRLSDRSGKVRGQKNSLDPLKLFCDYPFHQININPEGECFLCCRDMYYEVKMGNVMENSLKEIWGNDKYVHIRKGFKEGVKICDICKKCKSIGDYTI